MRVFNSVVLASSLLLTACNAGNVQPNAPLGPSITKPSAYQVQTSAPAKLARVPEGRWQSTSDPSYKLVITANDFLEYSGNQLMPPESVTFQNPCACADTQQACLLTRGMYDANCRVIVNHSGNRLELSDVGGTGKILAFTKQSANVSGVVSRCFARRGQSGVAFKLTRDGNKAIGYYLPEGGGTPDVFSGTVTLQDIFHLSSDHVPQAMFRLQGRTLHEGYQDGNRTQWTQTFDMMPCDDNFPN